jgi:hypothetical protein
MDQAAAAAAGSTAAGGQARDVVAIDQNPRTP